MPKKGHRTSEETKRKLSEANKGKKLSEETKRKLRIIRQSQGFPIKDTKPEKYLQKLLDEIEIEYRKHEAIYGQPDIFIKPNICIFIDGDYWHANPSTYVNQIGRKQSGYKSDDHIIGKKYAKDIWARDENVTKTLEERGYTVLRFYVSKIQKNPKKCLEKIIMVLK